MLYILSVRASRSKFKFISRMKEFKIKPLKRTKNTLNSNQNSLLFACLVFATSLVYPRTWQAKIYLATSYKYRV